MMTMGLRDISRLGKALAGVSLLLIPGLALAQQQPPSSPETQALVSKLQEEFTAEMQWRVRAIAAEEQVKALQAELDKLKTAKK